MTDELTKTFFDTFGIEPKNISTGECKYKITPEFCKSDCLDCKNTIKEKTYPQITDRILLELICILSKYQKNVGSLLEICETDKNSIKEEVLDMLIFRDTALKHQVRTLFEEG